MTVPSAVPSSDCLTSPSVAASVFLSEAFTDKTDEFCPPASVSSETGTVLPDVLMLSVELQIRFSVFLFDAFAIIRTIPFVFKI